MQRMVTFSGWRAPQEGGGLTELFAAQLLHDRRFVRDCELVCGSICEVHRGARERAERGRSQAAEIRPGLGAHQL